jgi:hypothetical protein
MRRAGAAALLVIVTSIAAQGSAVAEPLHIRRDHGGEVEKYKAKYREIAESGDRVIIDGICNSACTLVLGIVPKNKICVTPRASLGFHEAYTQANWPFGGAKIASASGTRDLMSYYPDPVQEWIARNGGLTPKMKVVKNGPDLWAMVLPCPEEW